MLQFWKTTTTRIEPSFSAWFQGLLSGCHERLKLDAGHDMSEIVILKASTGTGAGTLDSRDGSITSSLKQDQTSCTVTVQ